jgi:nicotinamidase-related amidase
MPSAVYPASQRAVPRVYEGDRRYALLVVDMLEDFVRGSLACERIQNKIPNIAALLESARAGGIPVIFCCDSHKPSDFELYRWGPHAMRGTGGAEIIKELAPKKGDRVVIKSCYNSFENTELEDVLRSLYGGRGANTLAITGVTTDCCVLHTTAAAFFRRYEVQVVEDGVDAFDRAQHEAGLDYIRYWYLCDVLSHKRLMGRMRI